MDCDGLNKISVAPWPPYTSSLLRDLEPATKPDALNPVLAHLPAGSLQWRGDAAVAVAPVFGRQGDDGAGQRILVGQRRRHVAWRAKDAGRRTLCASDNDSARKSRFLERYR